MAMQKYAVGESLTVLRGEEAQVVQGYRTRLGKSVSEFSKDELQALESDLAAVRPPAPKASVARKPAVKSEVADEK